MLLHQPRASDKMYHLCTHDIIDILPDCYCPSFEIDHMHQTKVYKEDGESTPVYLETRISAVNIGTMVKFSRFREARSCLTDRMTPPR